MSAAGPPPTAALTVMTVIGPAGALRPTPDEPPSPQSPVRLPAWRDVVEVGFAALDPPHRGTQLATFEADDRACSGRMTIMWQLTAAGHGTEIIVTATGVPAGIDQAVHEAGIAFSLANLAKYVEH